MLGATAAAYMRRAGHGSRKKSSGSSSKSSTYVSSGPRTGNENWSSAPVGPYRPVTRYIPLQTRDVINRLIANYDQELNQFTFNEGLPFKVYKQFIRDVSTLVSQTATEEVYEVGSIRIPKLATYATQKEMDADILKEMQEKREDEGKRYPDIPKRYQSLYPADYTTDKDGKIPYEPGSSCCRRGKSGCSIMGGRRRRTKRRHRKA